MSWADVWECGFSYEAIAMSLRWGQEFYEGFNGEKIYADRVDLITHRSDKVSRTLN